MQRHGESENADDTDKVNKSKTKVNWQSQSFMQLVLYSAKSPV